jgi:hypothetical protein
VAATVSLIELSVTKEQKVFTSRQAWIGALRCESCELLEHSDSIHGAASAEYQARQEL